MLEASVWIALLTTALLVYPRRPRTAGLLIFLMGVWTFALRYLPWTTQRVTAGYWSSWWMAAFWLAWGLIWMVRFSSTTKRDAHIAYWTAKPE